jgi:hypothetical protein
MTDRRFSQFYNAARSAAITARSTDPATQQRGQRDLEQALDLLSMEVSDGQSQMIEWASANGWPELETVERYGLVTP